MFIDYRQFFSVSQKLQKLTIFLLRNERFKCVCGVYRRRAVLQNICRAIIFQLLTGGGRVRVTRVGDVRGVFVWGVAHPYGTVASPWLQ